MIVQIYEVTTPAEARALGAMGVDHIGVLVGEGSFPREQTIEKAREILAAIPSDSKASALSLSHDVDLIVRFTAALLPDILHLGAAPQHLSPEQLLTLKAEFPQISLMRSIPVIDESSIALARSYEGIADWLLLDSYESGDRQIGALGVTHSWELDRRIIESVSIPVIVAGGLGPENVREAIRSARPAGVDSKTKTDKSDGSHTKDLQKISAFVAAARSLDQGTLTEPRENC
jgi:phosphoribosylanthranilate isomerase